MVHMNTDEDDLRAIPGYLAVKDLDPESCPSMPVRPPMRSPVGRRGGRADGPLPAAPRRRRVVARYKCGQEDAQAHSTSRPGKTPPFVRTENRLISDGLRSANVQLLAGQSASRSTSSCPRTERLTRTLDPRRSHVTRPAAASRWMW